jgi:serine/threonine-protein phosphatase 2A regulatory subunit A
MSSALSPEVLRDMILPTVLNLANDPIPNIRFNVAKSLEQITPIVKSHASIAAIFGEKIQPVLSKLVNDTDEDVRYYAQRALVTGILYSFVIKDHSNGFIAR